jgi:hypothetical protein
MNSVNQSRQKKSSAKFDNFLEAFKESGTNKSARPVNSRDSGAGFDMEAFLKAQEERIRQQERTRFEQIRYEEQVIYSREKQQEKLEIESLQLKIKQLAKEVGGVMVEAEKTAFQMVVAPGVYHKNFFKRLISLLEIARKSVHDSRTCLQLTNVRNQARSIYWASVKKAGTSFMLSSDRTVATQAG